MLSYMAPLKWSSSRSLASAAAPVDLSPSMYSTARLSAPERSHSFFTVTCRPPISSLTVPSMLLAPPEGKRLAKKAFSRRPSIL